MFRRILSRLAATFFGLKCDRCGCRGANLVFDAIRTSKQEIDGGRRVVKEFRVLNCSALCARCR